MWPDPYEATGGFPMCQDLIYVWKDSPRWLGAGMGQDPCSRLAGAGGDLSYSVLLVHKHLPGGYGIPVAGMEPQRGAEVLF